jgi:hypothetical protein
MYQPTIVVCVTALSCLVFIIAVRVGRVQLYRLSHLNEHTVAQNQYTGKIIKELFTIICRASLPVSQKCELSYSVLGMTENCIHTELKYYRTGCGVGLGGGKVENVFLMT